MKQRACTRCGGWLGGFEPPDHCANERACYGRKLTDHIVRRVKSVRGWSVELDFMVGTIMLSHGYAPCWVHATPRWDDGAIELPVQVSDDGGHADGFNAPVTWSGDLERDCARWVDVVSTVVAAVGCTLEVGP